MKYRSRSEIISNILRVVASSKATKTRLMYGAYLSYTQIEEYMGFILQQRLINQVPETNLYQLTEKGMQYLNLSDEIIPIVGCADHEMKWVMRSRSDVNLQSETFMQETIQSFVSTELQYRPRFKCQRHPSYPEIPPVTLHRGLECLV